MTPEDAAKPCVCIIDRASMHDLTRGAMGAQAQQLLREINVIIKVGPTGMSFCGQPADELHQFVLATSDEIIGHLG